MYLSRRKKLARLHKSTIAVSPDPLPSSEGLASETTAGYEARCDPEVDSTGRLRRTRMRADVSMTEAYNWHVFTRSYIRPLCIIAD